MCPFKTKCVISLLRTEYSLPSSSFLTIMLSCLTSNTSNSYLRVDNHRKISSQAWRYLFFFMNACVALPPLKCLFQGFPKVAEKIILFSVVLWKAHRKPRLFTQWTWITWQPCAVWLLNMWISIWMSSLSQLKQPLQETVEGVIKKLKRRTQEKYLSRLYLPHNFKKLKHYLLAIWDLRTQKNPCEFRDLWRKLLCIWPRSENEGGKMECH